MLRANLTMASNGRVVIPAQMRSALGLADGGKVVARLVDGVVVLEPIEAAIRRAQALVRRYVPEGADLIGELAAERRAAAEHE
ncbi:MULTISPECIES: AbrB/MazE/SpoVT family DNA-binding domain-containing protein [Nitrospirillum]|uniref:AbrB family looped-hinge helix DNA binding protein n=1 Tax=Nitrospirillum amazonense TaxID=28077 RepID=A0A560G3H3_9PROT|nr:AbrB/MazE/SpoVT family DNA-binding domain-containing protein [Nitrospirillum amazonense]MEC4594102.1 AbrB/MazE/SpoVT family DNA-binding domain-containing protein [Nitrospirillum amazonense]TWB28433.1 AbrB family looped-hinge helix DNA binding protein [Nitrospirillum amazonense]